MLEVIFTGRERGSLSNLRPIIAWVSVSPNVDYRKCRLELSKKYDDVHNIKLAEPRYKKYMV